MTLRSVVFVILASLGAYAVAIGWDWSAKTVNPTKSSQSKYHNERLKDDANQK
jgi:hypothetical protein